MLRFSPEQIKKFVEVGDRDLAERIISFVKEEIPDLLGDRSPLGLRHEVEWAIGAGRAVSVESDLGLAYFSVLTLLMGAGFEKQPDIAAYLRTPEVEKEELLEEFFEQVCDIAEQESD